MRVGPVAEPLQADQLLSLEVLLGAIVSMEREHETAAHRFAIHRGTSGGFGS
jgi:hypothetical protein